jgi:hypothetical protein
MFDEARARDLLEEITKKAKVDDDDIIVLGAIIHQLFSEKSPIAFEFSRLKSSSAPNAEAAGQGTDLTDRDREFQRLVKSAFRLIGPAKTPDQNDPKKFEERVAELVDRGFYKSELFKFAKWVLIIALVFIGAGTASLGGFTLTLRSQADDARKKLDEVTTQSTEIIKQIKEKEKALKEAQAETIKNIQNEVVTKAREYDGQLLAFVEQSKTSLSDKVKIAEAAVEEQKGKMVTSVVAGNAFVEVEKNKFVKGISDANIAIEAQKNNVKEYIDGEKKNLGTTLTAASADIARQQGQFATDLALLLEQTKGKIATSAAAGDAFIEVEKSKFVKNISDANIAIEAQKSNVSGYVVSAKEYLEAGKRDFATALTAASADIAQQQGKFATDLARLLEQTNGKVESEVARRLSVVAEAATNGAGKIDGDVKGKLAAIATGIDAEIVRIQQTVERKKSDLDNASTANIQSLDAALSAKLNLLNQQSIGADKAIDTVVGSLSARETSFVSAMNSRLSDWDQRVALQIKRIDDLAKTSGELQVKIKDVADQFGALLPSLKPALDVVNELKSGTVTGKLPWIGTVLENSAFLFIANLTIGLLAILIAVIGIVLSLRQRQQRPPPGEPAEAVRTPDRA